MMRLLTTLGQYLLVSLNIMINRELYLYYSDLILMYLAIAFNDKY